MTKFFTEAEEDMNMDVQVGPQEEIEAEIEPCNAVDQAKMDPATVVVAAVEKNEGCCKKEACGAKKEEACGQKEGCGKCEKCCREFYVDAKDVEKYAELTEQSMLEALNDIIAANEEAGMAADNLVVVMSEGTMGYTRNLEAHGAVCMFTEAADINVDVQVGPNEEEISVQEDPQTANPLDVVKKDYDTVVVAQKGDEFFMDVEDVQKCADLNCESVIKTLNGIIAANEEAGICADNIRVIVSENTSAEVINTLRESSVNIDTPVGRKALVKKVTKLCKEFLHNNGVDCSAVKDSWFERTDPTNKFIKGKTNTIRLVIGNDVDNVKDTLALIGTMIPVVQIFTLPVLTRSMEEKGDNLIKTIKSNAKGLEKDIKDETGYDCTVKFSENKMYLYSLDIEFKF